MTTKTAEQVAHPPVRLAEARRDQESLPLVDDLEARLHDALERCDYATADTVLRAIQQERASQREREVLDEIEGHLATARAGVVAVQQSLQAALDAEQAAHRIKQDSAEPGTAASVIDRDPTLASILRYLPPRAEGLRW